MSRPVKLTGTTQTPDGVVVRGRGLRNPMPAGPVPEFGLYLGTTALRRRYGDSISWPHEWLPWPDFLLPLDWRQAAATIVALRRRAQDGQAVEIACMGGVGRTGTVLACLATFAGFTAREAVAWTRTNYHHHAVETPWQRWWVAWFAKHTAA